MIDSRPPVLYRAFLGNFRSFVFFSYYFFLGTRNSQHRQTLGNGTGGAQDRCRRGDIE